VLRNALSSPDSLTRLRATLPRGRTLPLPIWQRRHRWMVRILWAHVVLVPLVGIVYTGYGLGHSALHAIPIAIFAWLSLLPLSRRQSSVLVALGLLTCSALLVHVTNGLIEAHFHFFVVVSILALYEDWTPYVLAFGYVVLHHGVFGTLSPQHVYAHGGSAWGWAAVHAGFIGAAGVANLVSWRMNEEMRAYAAKEGRGRHQAETVARTLSTSLMPEPIPELEDARVAVRYLTGEGEIGGDWFEVLDLSDGRIGIALGDVAGRGVSAAVMTGKLRHTLRAHAGEGMSPSEVLKRLDRIADESFATVAYAVVSPEDEIVRMASAGHPPPLVIDADGSARFVDRVQSMPLAGFGGAFPESEFHLPTGSSLVFYTDGLFERRDEDVESSLERLRAFADGITDPPEALCSRLLFGLVEKGAPDDTALVALQTVSPAVDSATITVPAAPEHLAALRRTAVKWARAVGVASAKLEGLALAVGEAGANAVEHSGTDTIAMHLRTVGDSAELVIRDFGGWREPAPPSSDDDLLARGRGLKLMSAFCDVQVDGRADGTDVTLHVAREHTSPSRPAPAGRLEALAGSS
jgi:anti-sigma regulatory factor (Ser/Thr protein kinase)